MKISIIGGGSGGLTLGNVMNYEIGIIIFLSSRASTID